MKSKILLILSIVIAGYISFSFVTECKSLFTKNEVAPSIVSDRYFKEIFDDFTIETMTYGKNTTQGGKETNLLLDVYQPKGDTLKKRPLFIFTHGGGFTKGSREAIKGIGWLQSMAKSGFVVASISYRLLDIPQTNISMPIAILNAVEDQRAAIRYFKKEAALFKIDTDEIFIGGYSAGAITSLHTAYMNSMEKVNTFLPPLSAYIKSHGGIEGNSGNPGFSSSIKGVVNIAGAIVTENLLDKTSVESLYSLHGEDDKVVSKNSGNGMQGSEVIHTKAKQLGVNSILKMKKNTGHDILYPCDSCRKEIQLFLAEQVYKKMER
ncbi:alpha/beta hydrolase [Aquimarina sp. RZ0]|uniref:alpha/beta hydrolase n=1 Tax=Aquimarina sp. RZ0 TaxID=2607730 RepID=UPI0011F357B1|nr:alpha/beta hydrolase [Aquimarina sp. RZ0]KAA1246914.1 alpha/beta hydrolase [Aquimarina sp. RZ0]